MIGPLTGAAVELAVSFAKDALILLALACVLAGCWALVRR